MSHSPPAEAKDSTVSFLAPCPHHVGTRSPVLSLNGAIASSQPLASEIGLRVLNSGGNCVDAAVAIAAALNVTEPCSTGIGGDCFALFYDAKTKTVEGMNGSGRSPATLTRDRAVSDVGELTSLPPRHAHTITVPGAPAGWADAVARWGKLPLKAVLQPAIDLAEQGVPVAPVTAACWAKSASLLQEKATALGTPTPFLVNGRAPVAGQVFKNPDLANTFRSLAQHGKEGFYAGRIAESIAQAVGKLGGTLTTEDMAEHLTTFPEPIHTNYHGVDVWEIPPNGQGLTALLALNILNSIDVKAMGHNSAAYLHHLIEALRLAFADCRWYIADQDHSAVPVKELLSEKYAALRRALIDEHKATADVKRGSPTTSSNTVSFSVVDRDGNACSFINSNYEGFGSAVVPSGCGFTLQNRGANFSLVEGHPNCVAPRKRPYHTIIPGMATKDGDLFAPFSVMGGFMQPQGHVQVLINMIDFGMDPQRALDAPRFCISDGTAEGVIGIEEGIAPEVLAELKARGRCFWSEQDIVRPRPGHPARCERRVLVRYRHTRRRNCHWFLSGSSQYTHMHFTRCSKLHTKEPGSEPQHSRGNIRDSGCVRSPRERASAGAGAGAGARSAWCVPGVAGSAEGSESGSGEEGRGRDLHPKAWRDREERGLLRSDEGFVHKLKRVVVWRGLLCGGGGGGGWGGGLPVSPVLVERAKVVAECLHRLLKVCGELSPRDGLFKLRVSDCIGLARAEHLCARVLGRSVRPAARKLQHVEQLVLRHKAVAVFIDEAEKDLER